MTNTISVPRDLLIDVRDSTNEAGNLSYRQHHIDHHRRLTRKLDELLEAPAVEVEGLEVIGFHCMDSAGIETLEWRGGSYADEPLCSLPKAQAIIEHLQETIASFEEGSERMAIKGIEMRLELDQQAARIKELEKDADRYRWLRHMTTKERTYIVQQEYDKVMDMFLDESMKGGRNE